MDQKGEKDENSFDLVYEDFDSKGNFFVSKESPSKPSLKNSYSTPQHNNMINQKTIINNNINNNQVLNCSCNSTGVSKHEPPINNYGNHPHNQPFSFQQQLQNPFQQFYYNPNINPQMFAKPRTFQSQELGGGQNTYFQNYPNNFNIYDHLGQNQNYTRFPSGSVHSSNSNSLNHMVSSPELNRSHYTQNYIRENSGQSQSGTQNSTITTQSKNNQSNHKKSHDNLKYNNFNMNELKKNLVLPPKKFSENSPLEPSKFNSKTMSILEKKNMDDTKNLVDFLNGLDEELIDYVRTQKGSR